MRKKWNWKFNLVSLLLCTFPFYGFGQVSEKTFVQENDYLFTRNMQFILGKKIPYGKKWISKSKVILKRIINHF